MAQALSTSKNNYLESTKNHSIFTALPVCKWLDELIQPVLPKNPTILDPCCGTGNLTLFFVNALIINCDITDHGAGLDNFIQADFLDWKKDDKYEGIDLVMINPPYNHSVESREKWGKTSLLPELFVDKCFELFGKNIKIILFTPMGLLLNTRCKTKKQGTRYRHIRDDWGQITSIVSLPLDCFHNPDFDTNYSEQNKSPEKFKTKFEGLKASSAEVLKDPIKYFQKSNLKRKETHQQIIFFNMPELKPHYCLPESVIEELREIDKEMV
jgi:type I restriction enzyme M protein